MVAVSSEDQIKSSKEFPGYSESPVLPSAFPLFNEEHEAIRLLLALFNTGSNIDESINLLNCLSKNSDALEDTGLVTVKEYRQAVGCGYRIDIFRLATKSLMKRVIEDGDYTAQEVMFLYQTLKSHVIVNEFEVIVTEENELVRRYDPAFLSSIAEIESIFKEFMEATFHISATEFEKLKLNSHDFITSSTFQSLKKSINLNVPKLIERFSLLSVIYMKNLVYGSDLETFENAYQNSTTNTEGKTISYTTDLPYHS